MKFRLQILFFLITWFSNLVYATPVFTKVALSSYELSSTKTENVKEESVVKICFQIPRAIGITRSEITENEPPTTHLQVNTFLKTLFSNDENGNFSSLTSEEYQSNASLMAQQQELAAAIDIICVIGSVGGASGTAVYTAVNKLNQLGEFTIKIGKSTWSQGKTLFKTLVVSRGLSILKVGKGVGKIFKPLGKVGDYIINSIAGDIRKFSEYALTNPTKTGLFVDSWGYKLADAENLLTIYKNQAIQALKDGKLIANGVDDFGNQLFKIETILNTPLKGEVRVYAGWIIKPNKVDEVILSTPFDGFVK